MFIAYRLDGRYNDTFSCEKKMLVFSAPTLGTQRLMVGEASPSVLGCHTLKCLSCKKDTLDPGGGERGVAILGMLVDCNLFSATDVVVRRQACECEFYFLGEKRLWRDVRPFSSPPLEALMLILVVVVSAE